MSIAVYSVNSFLKADTELANIAGKTMNFFPVIGYGTEAPPFAVYFFNPVIPDVESFWNRVDSIRYAIYDNDVDRLFRISERIIYLLGRGDTVQESGGITSNTHIFKSSIFVGSSLMEPIEKEGWYQMDLDFRIYSLKQ